MFSAKHTHVSNLANQKFERGFNKGVAHTQTLCGGTLEQVINGSTHNNTLAAGVNGKAANLNTVASGNVLHQRGLANDLDELLTSVALLVDVADIARSQLLLEGNADGLLDQS